MIIPKDLDVKQSSLLSSLLGSSNAQNGGESAFTKLLATLKDSKASGVELKDIKPDQSALLLEVDEKTDTKSSVLSKLLHSKDIDEKDLETLKEDIKEINPKLVSTLSVKELKIVINEAKEYLKNKLSTLSGTKLEELPKTLKGLLTLAKKENIDVKSLSLTQGTNPLESSKTTPNVVDTSSKDFQKETKSIALFAPREAKTASTKELIAQKSAKTLNVEDKKVSKLESLLHAKNNTDSKSDIKSEDLGQKIVQVAGTKQNLNINDTDTKRDFSSLLHDNKEDNESTPKISSGELNLKNSESLEVKVVEAKQLTKHFATQIAKEIEDYKPPFVKLKMKLNPVKLGEVDVTMVQRGSNVHINLSSNQVALTTLLQNAGDLKQALAQNGINSASMSFSSGNFSDQNQQHQNQQAQKFYEDIAKYNNEEVESLEIIVPRYV